MEIFFDVFADYAPHSSSALAVGMGVWSAFEAIFSHYSTLRAEIARGIAKGPRCGNVTPMVGDAGLEPARLATPDPKSGLSASFSSRPDALVSDRRLQALRRVYHRRWASAMADGAT